MQKVGNDNKFGLNSKRNGKPLKCVRCETEWIKSEFQKDLTVAQITDQMGVIDQCNKLRESRTTHM